MVCLSCTATGERVCLAAEGFGNRHCFLENIADKVSITYTIYKPMLLISSVFQNIPPDLSQCVFVIEQALSVRALQELVTAAGSETVSIAAQFGYSSTIVASDIEGHKLSILSSFLYIWEYKSKNIHILHDIFPKRKLLIVLYSGTYKVETQKKCQFIFLHNFLCRQ